MRCCWIVILELALLVPAAQGQDDAKKLYDAVEEKLSKAKAYTFDFETNRVLSAKTGGARRFKGTVILASGNRLKITATGNHTSGSGKIQRTLTSNAVSDGTTLYSYYEEQDLKPRTSSLKVPADLGKSFTSAFISSGLPVILEMFGKPKEKVQAPRLSEFTVLNSKSPKGIAAGKVIEFTIDDPNSGIIGRRVLQLDSQTSLPLLLTLRGERGHSTRFTNWEIDPNIPEGTFDVPK